MTVFHAKCLPQETPETPCVLPLLATRILQCQCGAQFLAT